MPPLADAHSQTLARCEKYAWYLIRNIVPAIFANKSPEILAGKKVERISLVREDRWRRLLSKRNRSAGKERRETLTSLWFLTPQIIVSLSPGARLAGARQGRGEDAQVLAFLDVAHEQVFVFLGV